MPLWKQHLYTHKLASYWKDRELTSSEKSWLYWKMVFNYYGFWVNKVLHLIPFYYLYKRKFFTMPNEIKFWTSFGIIVTVMCTSAINIDRVFNRALVFEVEELSDKYNTELDEFRKEYLLNKAEKDMNKMLILQEMKEEGKVIRGMMGNDE